MLNQLYSFMSNNCFSIFILFWTICLWFFIEHRRHIDNSSSIIKIYYVGFTQYFIWWYSWAKQSAIKFRCLLDIVLLFSNCCSLAQICYSLVWIDINLQNYAPICDVLPQTSYFAVIIPKLTVCLWFMSLPPKWKPQRSFSCFSNKAYSQHFNRCASALHHLTSGPLHQLSIKSIF